MASEGRNSLPRIHTNFREKIEKFVPIRETCAEPVEVFVAEVLGLPVKNGRAIISIIGVRSERWLAMRMCCWEHVVCIVGLVITTGHPFMRAIVFSARRLAEDAVRRASLAGAVGQTSSIFTQGARNARSGLVSTAGGSFIVVYVQNSRVSELKRFKATAGFITRRF
jgi:hypothetical protein